MAPPAALGVDLVFKGAYGIGIVSDQAFAAGAASVPGPWSDPDFPWLVWESFEGLYIFHDATGQSNFQGFQFDSKAMRKVKQNETVVVVCESQAGAFDLSSAFRMLVKLS